MGDEMTLRQFVESIWFKGLARGAMILGVPALTAVSGFVGYTLSTVKADQVTLRNDLIEVQVVQADRAEANDRFQADISADVAEVKSDVGGVKASVFTVQQDVATIKGILQEMQRRDLAKASFAAPSF